MAVIEYDEYKQKLQALEPTLQELEKALSILKSHPCVQTISLREQDICVRFSGDAQDEAILLQQLIDSDVLVNGFTREKGSLETVFMQLTDHEEERVVTSYEAESGL